MSARPPRIFTPVISTVEVTGRLERRPIAQLPLLENPSESDKAELIACAGAVGREHQRAVGIELAVAEVKALLSARSDRRPWRSPRC